MTALGCLVSAGSCSYDTFCTEDFASFESTPTSSLASFEQTVDPMAERSVSPAVPIVSEVEIHRAILISN